MNPKPNQLVDRSVRYQLIENQPLTKNLSFSDIHELSSLMQEVEYSPGEIIVEEGSFIDCFYLIVRGKAKVTQTKITTKRRKEEVIVAKLEEGEAIGFSDKGFLSPNFTRTSTVTALTSMLLLRVSIKSFEAFLKEHHIFYQALKEMTATLIRLDLIKKTYPFVRLSNNEIIHLAKRIKEVTYPPDTLLFKQGDLADECFLLTSGSLELFSHNIAGIQHITTLTPPYFLGETAILAPTHQNTSARTREKSTVLILKKIDLLKLSTKSIKFSQSLMAFTAFRFRPLPSKDVVIKHRISKDKQKIVLLHHTDQDHYYRLSEEAFFVWNQLDGAQTIQDITVSFFKKYGVFVPEMISNLLTGLSEMGFILIPSLAINNQEPVRKGIIKKMIDHIKPLLAKEFTHTKTDSLFTTLYNKVAYLIFTSIGIVILSLIVLAGLIAFIANSPHILSIASLTKSYFSIFVLLLILVSFIGVIFHEAGHAFTAKKFGFKIQRVGMGWFAFSPIFFVDTSEVWLAEKNKRLAVNSAGVFVDMTIAGLLALLSLAVGNTELSILLWLLSLFTYYTGIKNLSPIKDFDGYLILSDIFDYAHLRKLSMKWLADFIGKKPDSTIKQYDNVKYYWLLSLLYLLVSTSLFMFILYALVHIFSLVSIFGISPTYFIIGIPLLILILNIYWIVKSIKIFLYFE
jgi:CRP-like cAMP-binding protein